MYQEALLQIIFEQNPTDIIFGLKQKNEFIFAVSRKRSVWSELKQIKVKTIFNPNAHIFTLKRISTHTSIFDKSFNRILLKMYV